MLTTFLPPKLEWPISIVILIGMPKYIYTYNILRT